MNTSIVKLFEQQVALNAEQTAVCFEGNKMTYKALNERSNQVARCLFDMGVQPGDVIGLLFDRSTDFIIAMWGVLKAGATYLPLEPELPRKRINFMLEKSNSSNLITQSKYVDQYSEGLNLFTIDDEKVSNQSMERLDVETTSSDPAYCIFTSGSTGHPKGVLMNQSSVISLVQGLKKTIYDAYSNENIRVALIASFSFDASVQQIFSAHLMGHSLYIADDESRKNGESLRAFYNDNAINVSDGTPTHLRLLVKSCTTDSRLNSLTSWLLAGEILTKKSVKAFYETFGYNTQLYNLYGPTETCVDSTCFKIDPMDLDAYDSIPIGKPLPNERIYIADAEGSVVAEGEVGELCIAGEGLAEGYLNDEALTREKFKENYIDNESMVYCTGDMGKASPDGNLLYHGRIDNQIKLRGLRIELSEVEFQMCMHPHINHAVVVVKELFEEEQLVGYYEATEEIEASVLRKYLVESLPTYMVPSDFLHMEHLPMTVNGKVDRHALPDIEVASTKNNTGFNEVQKKLIAIWEEVLEAPENWIGLETNFFQLGGNSLKSLLIANRVKKEFDVEISLAQFFELQTIAKFSDFITNAKTKEYARILPSDVDGNSSATLAQKCLYFIDSLHGKKSASYNIPQVFKLSGNLDVEKLNNAFRKLIQRHEILRTSFHEAKDGIQCEVYNEFDFSIEPLIFDGDIESSVLGFIRSFDLSKGPLLRAGLAKINEEDYYLIFDIHHIVSDEISNRILIEDLLGFYKGEAPAEPRLRYMDYAVWQQEEYYQNLVAEDKKYWIDIYSEKIPILDLPTDFPRPVELENGAHVSTINLGKSLSDELRGLMKEEGTTMFNFLFATYYLFLSKISNQEDIVVGTPVSGRHHVDLEKIVGLFVNTLALRNKPKGEMSIREFLLKLQDNTLQALDHQAYPYKELVDAIKIPRDISRNPLFDVFFNYSQILNEEQDHGIGFQMERYDIPFRVAKFDLTLEVADSPDAIELTLIGHKDLFELETVNRFAGYLKYIIEQVLVNPGQRIQNINILPDQEMRQLLSYNRSNAFEERSVLEAFTEQVRRRPENSAVIFHDEVLTYRELEMRSNQLAHYLISKGVDKEQFVGICLDRSVEMIVSVLAILKIGAAYVPFDIELPEERIAFQLEDANISWMLSTSKNQSALEEKGCTVIALDTNKEEILLSADKPVEKEVRPGDLMYVIYTSGSTGRPKGVMVEHRSVLNMALEQIKEFEVTEEDKVIQFASLTFDASISEILMALLAGAGLVLVEKDQINDGKLLIKYMEKQEVSVVTLSPPYLKVLDKSQLTFLRCIITAGEAANVEDAQYLSRHMTYYNAYGPTECAVCISINKVDSKRKYKNQIPIGEPLRNLNVYILDQNNNLCPTGVLGELCVSGIGVARGYLNLPELTEEKFARNPLDPSERMYRTGDYAKWNNEGELEFLGRRDNQVKIRGFRIELGEIEAAIDLSGLVKQTSVQVKEDKRGNKHIVAYVVPSAGYVPSEVQNYLANKLPNYMIPSSLVSVKNIPLTAHGKVDRDKLMKNLTSRSDLTRPINAIEEELLEIWSEALGIEPDTIGTNDNFFEFGGNSLNGMQIINTIGQRFNADLTISEIFKFQTIAQLARQIEIDQWLKDSNLEGKEEKRKEALI